MVLGQVKEDAMIKYKEACGCKSINDPVEKWVEICPQHKAEFDAVHERWAVEYRASAARFDAMRGVDKPNL